MNKTSLAWATCLVFSLVSGLPVQAQTAYAPPPAPVYTQQQLDQMLAPVALYPDSLLAQVLMASTYPLEVVQAQRFVEARPGLQGDGLARAVAPMPWDPSVKALVQFPSVLAMLNDRLDWTQQLGQAFLAQQPSVMDTVQNLRERARIAGTLESSPQQRVVVQDEVIEIVPVNPQVVYVPYYNPTVVYGSWWWPSAPPVVWAPPPRYRPPSYEPGFSASISFGVGIGVMSAVFGDARPDWRQRQVMVTQTRINNVTNVTNVNNVNNTNVINNRYVNNNINVNRNVSMNQRPVVWHHDPRYAGGRYAQQPAPALAPPPGQRPLAGPQAQNLVQAQHVPQWNGHAPQPQAGQPFPSNAPRALPVADNVQQRLAQQDQFRQRQAIDQQRQREQQANDQQRQQQVQQQQQRQQQMQQQQLQQQQREQQMRQHQQQEQQRQQQMMNQLREQQHRQMEQARQQQQQHQAAQHEQQARQQQAQQRDAHQRREDRRDERS
ncbi:DUF3300 domain-containing protein [Herbaspirillum huttiense]|uniref:DUF3300 domain-containing protein n=1 Tax=Herbaspirillum huttiense TaxID=863372 RepID=UPI002176A374|nr:DUF3300 domain-containing protein [Herbaspirillum huttiense]UWE14505.1 DUF3300 domain-containing protein [Herbaspirillum huttiense]